MTDVFSKKKRSAIMALIRGKNTQPEKAMKKILRNAGLSYRSHLASLPGTPDFALPDIRVAIFIDGCFWHGHRCERGRLPTTNVEYWKKKIANNIRRDKERRRALRQMGWKVIGLWTCRDPEEIFARLPIPVEKRPLRNVRRKT